MLNDFIAKYTGQVTGTNDVNMGQCVGLVMKYVTDLGLPFFPGNAKDLLDNAPSNFEKIKNDTANPDQVPQPGDIVVFSSVWGNGYGHTGICVSASPSGFTLFEQNNPVGATPHLVNHPASHYETVLGWLRNVPTGDDMIDKNTLDELFLTYFGRYPDQGAYDHYVGKYTASFVIGDLANSQERKDFLAAKASELKSLNDRIGAAESDAQSLHAQLTTSVSPDALQALRVALDDKNTKYDQAVTQITELTAQIQSSKEKLPLFDKTTPAGKSYRTLLQALGAFITLAGGSLALPEVKTFLAAPENATTAFVALTALYTYAHNKLEEMFSK